MSTLLLFLEADGVIVSAFLSPAAEFGVDMIVSEELFSEVSLECCLPGLLFFDLFCEYHSLFYL